MINASKNKIVFLNSGEQLNQEIIASLWLAHRWILRAYGLEGLDLERVNSKFNAAAIVPALIEGYILRDEDTAFDEDYVLAAFTVVSAGLTDIEPSLYARLTVAKTDGKRSFRKSYLPHLIRGLSAFLIALHIKRAIVLPYSFTWPMGYLHGEDRRRLLGRREICQLEELPELLTFLRLTNNKVTDQSNAALGSYNIRQRILHLVVAAGWLTLDDVNYDDLYALYQVNEKTCFTGEERFPAATLVDVLSDRFKSRIPVSRSGWQAILSDIRKVSQSRRAEESNQSGEMTDEIILEYGVRASAGQFSIENLRNLTHLPGIERDVQSIVKDWLAVESAFISRVKQENYKRRLHAIGILNAYLYGYLPYWYEAHPEFPYAFPDCPGKMVSAVFVSDLGLLGRDERPVTFVEFTTAVATDRTWGNTTHYSYLKQLEVFFSFIERFQDHLPGCTGFQQPLSEHDFPATARSYGTKKRPIPRRLFKFYIGYVEALAALSNVLMSRILSGDVPDDRLSALRQGHTVVIDCFQHQELLGFIPVIFYRGKTIPLRRIPNVLTLDKKCLKDGRRIRVPHPHALHQILVALLTGLRHNHIQWLDAETFDSHVEQGANRPDFAKLHVNTDKSKTSPWHAHVNFRVIEILRDQLAWRQVITEPGFSNRVFYNNNPDTKWGKFYPLFAYSSDGRPHHDTHYATTWVSLLSGVQSMLQEIGETPTWLVRLLPSSIPYADPDQEQMLYDYGSEQKRVCKLMLKSDITPHSARVSVVSHAISILPADLIGRYWTGQTEATVYHYVSLEVAEMGAEQQRQNLMWKQRGYDHGYEAMLASTPSKVSPFVKADGDSSRLTQDLRTNIEETISAYGCVSLSLNCELKTGIDILTETRASGAISNKTEICPYGNQCPTEIVIALKGFRRCGPCQYAVRSIDHLPAITAKIRQVLEGLKEIENRLDSDGAGALTDDEWDALAKNRDILAEDLAAWQIAAEVLEVMRQRIEDDDNAKVWLVQRPEIIEKHLKRVKFPTESTDYLLARLHESEAFPALESPQIRARFDLLRRNILANTGNIREALRSETPANPGAECRGLIRSIAAAHKLGIEDIRRMMNEESAETIPARKFRLLPPEILK